MFHPPNKCVFLAGIAEFALCRREGELFFNHSLISVVRYEVAEMWSVKSESFPNGILVGGISACGFLTAGGWVLSVLGILSFVGTVGLIIVLPALVYGFFRLLDVKPALPPWRPRRFRRLLPALYGFACFLIFAGGIAYAPSNFDAMAYRIPRVLNWIAEGHWHWITSPEPRMNSRFLGFEWLMVPFLGVLRSDRLIFLINFGAYLLMPGTFFQLLRCLGLPGRASWNLAWIIPSGYVFAIQAGSIGNDSLSAVFFCGALVFACRSARTRSYAAFWLSALAIALASSTKASNVVLGLPWLVAIWPAWRVPFRRPALTVFIGGFALLVSFVPIAAINWRHCGDWTGLGNEIGSIPRENPAVALLGNGILVALQNLLPPVIPQPAALKDAVHGLIPSGLLQRFQGFFEAGYDLGIGELVTEERAGLGFGVSWLFVTMIIVGAARFFGRPSRGSDFRRIRWDIVLASLFVLSLLLSKSFYAPVSRYLCVFYPLIIGVAGGMPGVSRFMRTRVWSLLCLIAYATTYLVLALTPARPLMPMGLVFDIMRAAGLPAPLIDRASKVYEFYGLRPRCMEAVIRALPPDADQIGFIFNMDEPHSALWQSFGSRRVVDVMDLSDLPKHRQNGIRCFVASPLGFSYRYKTTIEEFLKNTSSRVIARVEVPAKVSSGRVIYTIFEYAP